ncbi:DUF4136 domain-containing protein [Povalibacter sp.]|uniref:DUF4136 domain-containing protein n=1 Tax=Povalibacter sp. TaxID=1962978 RepID=UPI002F4164CD
MRIAKVVCTATMMAMAAGLAACASGPTIRADADPTVNLSSYKTFGFYEKVSTDRSAYTTLISTRLKEATRTELTKRGYTFTETNPQLLANFNLNIENRQDVQSTPSAGVGVGMGGYYGYRSGMYGVWGGYPQDVETVHYQVGTLAIDLVDAAKKQLVWQGTAEGRINKKAIENPGPAIDSVVGEIFAKYPVPAPGAPAN